MDTRHKGPWKKEFHQISSAAGTMRLGKDPEVDPRCSDLLWVNVGYIYIYILYTLGALGFRRVSRFSLIHMSKTIVSPQRNVDFAHSSFSFFNDNVTELNFMPAQVACYDMLSTVHVNCDFHVFLHEIPLFMNFFVLFYPELSFFTAARGVIWRGVFFYWYLQWILTLAWNGTCW